MRIEKAFIGGFLGEAGSGPIICDVLGHKGAIWLVPQWLNNHATGKSKPARIIGLDFFPHQKMEFLGCQYLLNQPMPRAVFDGRESPTIGNIRVVVENPDIEVDNPTLLQ